MHSIPQDPFQPLTDAVNALVDVDPTPLSDCEVIELLFELERCACSLAALSTKMDEENALTSSRSSGSPHPMPPPTYERHDMSAPGAAPSADGSSAPTHKSCRGLEREDNDDSQRHRPTLGNSNSNSNLYLE